MCKDRLQTFLGKKEEEKLKSDKDWSTPHHRRRFSGQKENGEKTSRDKHQLTEIKIKTQDGGENIGTANVHEGQEVGMHTLVGLE